jgi:phosphonatase-like hydrolase
MSDIELVVFDMAGTTIQDRGQVLDSFRKALDRNGIKVADEELQKWRGAAKREVLRFFIQQQFGIADVGNVTRVEQAYADFRALLESSYASEAVEAIPGVEETFAWLRDHRIKIALTTGFYRKVTDTILDVVGWKDAWIDASICSDDVAQGRPAPFMIFRAMEATGVIDTRRVINVGDTALDLQAGMNAGINGVVGVLSGSQTITQLGAVQHTHIIASVANLPALIENEFS